MFAISFPYRDTDLAMLSPHTVASFAVALDATERYRIDYADASDTLQ